MAVEPAAVATPKKVRVLTPAELTLVDELQAALVLQATAEASVRTAKRTLTKLTEKVNELDRPRTTAVWLEARDQAQAALSGGRK